MRCINGRAISSTGCVIPSYTHRATTSGSTAGKPGLAAMRRRSDWRGFGRSSTRRPRGRRIPLVSQPEFIENVRWTDHSLVFATVQLIGSGNGRRPFPNRTEDDIAASKTRTEAAAAWLRDTFREATWVNAPALVVAMQGALFDEEPKDREPFEPFLTTLREEAARFGRPVLVAHGDQHEYTVDRQLGLANLTRLEVPGSPNVGWVRVTITPNAREPFAFEPHVIPRWKVWSGKCQRPGRSKMSLPSKRSRGHHADNLSSH
jgi:hypothetical protein